MLVVVKLAASAPKTWPYMKSYDIWEANKTVDTYNEQPRLIYSSPNYVVDSNFVGGQKSTAERRRKSKGESCLQLETSEETCEKILLKTF